MEAPVLIGYQIHPPVTSRRRRTRTPALLPVLTLIVDVLLLLSISPITRQALLSCVTIETSFRGDCQLAHRATLLRRLLLLQLPAVQRRPWGQHLLSQTARSEHSSHIFLLSS